ncbi:MAG: HEPN domain-containing protein [Burkholderiaceae bacterium]
MKREEWQRYRRQADHTWQSARGDRAQGAFDWACFNGHQAAELAARGYVRATARYATGHSVVKLLGEMGAAPPESLVDCAKALDKVYIPARYPDAYDAGAPMDDYTAADADAALDWAQRILEWLDDLAGR